MRVDPWCDDSSFIKGFKRLYLDENGEKELKVLSCRPHGNITLLMLDGIDTIEAAAAMRGKVLYMCRKDAKLPKGRYFVSELIGCEVFDADDESKTYGTLSDVSYTGANDVCHIKTTDGKEYLIPCIPDVVIDTDIYEGIMKIRPIKGIFGDED